MKNLLFFLKIQILSRSGWNLNKKSNVACWKTPHKNVPTLRSPFRSGIFENFPWQAWHRGGCPKPAPWHTHFSPLVAAVAIMETCNLQNNLQNNLHKASTKSFKYLNCHGFFWKCSKPHSIREVNLLQGLAPKSSIVIPGRDPQRFLILGKSFFGHILRRPRRPRATPAASPCGDDTGPPNSHGFSRQKPGSEETSIDRVCIAYNYF